ncbi:MAG TPA: hypothetical protein VMS65_10225 [Polyangiaceae bacterium]|nr:hypothetical protein [Polyangiaceae bacterium]
MGFEREFCSGTPLWANKALREFLERRANSARLKTLTTLRLALPLRRKGILEAPTLVCVLIRVLISLLTKGLVAATR